MAWVNFYHRHCRFCKARIIMGEDQYSVWRAYEYPPPAPGFWPIHECRGPNQDALKLPTSDELLLALSFF